MMKKKLKTIICPLLFSIGYFNRKLKRLSEEAVILMYHRFGDTESLGVSEKNFNAQMRYLAKNMSPVPLTDLVNIISEKKPIPSRSVAVTIDDGYEDNYRIAYPILKKLGIPVTIFLATGYIESTRAFWWDKVIAIMNKKQKACIHLNEFQEFSETPMQDLENISFHDITSREQVKKRLLDLFKRIEYKRIPDATEKLRHICGVRESDALLPAMLNWAQIREMDHNGIEFGAHTVTHPDLTAISIEEAKKEIMESKRIIEKQLNKPVKHFAYPYGLSKFYNAPIRDIVKRFEFSSCCTAEPGIITAKSDPFTLKRVSMPNDSLSQSLWKMTKYYS